MGSLDPATKVPGLVGARVCVSVCVCVCACGGEDCHRAGLGPQPGGVPLLKPGGGDRGRDSVLAQAPPSSALLTEVIQGHHPASVLRASDTTALPPRDPEMPQETFHLISAYLIRQQA